MSDGLAGIDDVTLVHPTEGNEVFAAMPDATADALAAAGCKFQRDWRLHPRHHRFVTSWATADEDVDRLLDVCRSVSSGDLRVTP
jgi:threonine aldolase